jgi:GGDEF domain-containing protein
MPVKIFCCYAHEDEQLLNKLKTHLSPLQRQDLIDIWHDRDISPGTEWEHEVRKHLNEAQIILLLVSPSFLNSEFCYGIEMERAMERHISREACVIPVILHSVYWQDAPFGKLQALPANGKPITGRSWQNHNEAFLEVVKGIKQAVKEIQPVQEIGKDKQVPSYPDHEQRDQSPPPVGEGKADYIDRYLEASDLQLFWRYFVPCVLRLSLRLLCHDRPDTIAGLIMPLDGADTSPSVPRRPEDLSMVGKSLIGWIVHNSSFSIFYSAAPAFKYPGYFRVFPLQAEGEDAPKDRTLIVVQRNTRLLALSVPVVETIQRILTPIYEEVEQWKHYFMRDSLHPAVDFYRSTTPPDPLLNGLADMIVRLGGRMTDERDRWRFCIIVLPKETGRPLVGQSLVVQGQSEHSPYKIGEWAVPPEEAARSLSLRAYQSGSIVYRHKVGKEDSIRFKDVEGDFRSAIAIPVGGENGKPVAVMYAVSDEVDAFSPADQCVMRMLGRIIEELLVTYSVRQRGATRLMELIADPSTVDPSFLDFSSDHEFVLNVEDRLSKIKEHMEQDKPSAEGKKSVSFLAIDVDNVGGLAKQYGDRIMKNLGREVGYRIRRQLHSLLENYDKFELYHAYADRFYVVLPDFSLEQARTYAEPLRRALRGDYKVEAYGNADEQPAQPTLTAVTGRIAVTSYPYSHLEQLLGQYPEETAVVDVRASISSKLDNGLKVGSDRGGDRVVFWDYKSKSWRDA